MIRCLALLLITVPAAAQAQTVPASFGSGENTLGALIEFPEVRGDLNHVVNCIGVVQRNGKLDKHGCFRISPGDETFAAVIYKAAKKARLEPALYDGKPVDVIFYYRIQFLQKGDERQLNFVANPGYEENVDAYGPDHVAAQRVYTGEAWQPACPRYAEFTVLARANVDFDGTPSYASLEHGKGLTITERCEKAIIDDLLASRFIPAMADGEFVPSTFVQAFGN